MNGLQLAAGRSVIAQRIVSDLLLMATRKAILVALELLAMPRVGVDVPLGTGRRGYGGQRDFAEEEEEEGEKGK